MSKIERNPKQNNEISAAKIAKDACRWTLNMTSDEIRKGVTDLRETLIPQTQDKQADQRTGKR